MLISEPVDSNMHKQDPQIPVCTALGKMVPPHLVKTMAWRFYDHPMPGTIFRLPDDLSLQRGITYTFLPDGRRLRVPSMNRLQVRAESQSHQEGHDSDIVQALQDIISGKKPVSGRPSFNQRGRAHRVPAHRRVEGYPGRQIRGEGLRPVGIVEAPP
jgi:hypothetical protein